MRLDQFLSHIDKTTLKTFLYSTVKSIKNAFEVGNSENLEKCQNMIKETLESLGVNDNKVIYNSLDEAYEVLDKDLHNFERLLTLIEKNKTNLLDIENNSISTALVDNSIINNLNDK